MKKKKNQIASSFASFTLSLSFTLAIVLALVGTSGLRAHAQSGNPAGNPSANPAGNPSANPAANPPSRPGPNPAANPPKTDTPRIENPLSGVNNVEELIFSLINIALRIGAIAAVLALIWVGFRFITARGNADKLVEARQSFYWTLIGIAVLFGAKLISTIIQATIESISHY